MSSDTLREQLNRTPFYPVTLFLPSGKTVTVRNPELYMFTETRRTLLVSEGEKVMFIDVATVEAKQRQAE